MTPWWRSSPRAARLLLLGLAGTAALAPALPAPARGQGVFDAIGAEVNRIFEQSKAAVVRVRAQQGRFETIGSGFFIDDKGVLVTSAANLGASNEIVVGWNGQDFPARVLGADLRSGVAVLQISAGKTPCLSFARKADLRTATPVVGIGYPLNLPAAPTFGMVTGFDTQFLDRFFATTHLRTSLSISPGQIGGPVLDGRGQVVGMIVMAADERQFTYALPTPAIAKVLADFGAHGRVEHGWVGVGVDPRSEEKAVRVTQIFAGAPAAASGLEPGDIVVRIGQREIVRPSDVIDASFFAQVGEEMPVAVLRGGKAMTFKLIVTERPAQVPVILPTPETMGIPTSAQGLKVGAKPAQ